MTTPQTENELPEEVKQAVVEEVRGIEYAHSEYCESKTFTDWDNCTCGLFGDMKALFKIFSKALAKAEEEKAQAVDSERRKVLEELLWDERIRHRELRVKLASRPVDKYSVDYLGGKVRESTLACRYLQEKIDALSPQPQTEREEK